MHEYIRSAWSYVRKLLWGTYTLIGVLAFGLDKIGEIFNRGGIAVPWGFVLPILILLASADAYHKLRLELLISKEASSVEIAALEFERYRTNLLGDFTAGLSMMFYRFSKKENLENSRWEHYADKATLANAGNDDPTLTRFAEAVYTDGVSPSAIELWKRSASDLSITFNEFEAFHRSRQEIGQYFDRCERLRLHNSAIEQYLLDSVRPNNARITIMLSYLARPLAIATSSNIELTSVGWYRLATWWEREQQPF